jgi:Beta protein
LARHKEMDRTPNYGDYTIVHPEFTPRDMRLIKSGGKIVYTAHDEWIVRKGGAFRDDPSQMHGHCADIIASGKFRGAGFSEGDNYIEKCAKQAVGPSTLTRWKEIGINHHIMHVLEDLSKHAASA